MKRKNVIYMILCRLPMEVQENLDSKILMLNNDWKGVMSYYWQLRYNSVIKGHPMEAHRNFVTRFGIKKHCSNCKKPFSQDVTTCWRCHKYTCWNCINKYLHKDQPLAKAQYTYSCNSHIKSCKKCQNPFIPYTNTHFEVYCFPCQHATGMYDEIWQTVSKNQRLPYGTWPMRRDFAEYINRVGVAMAPDNLTTVYGYDSIAIGSSAIVSGYTATAVGYNAGMGLD